MFVTYELPEILSPDLAAACRERGCTVREFIGELLHAELAGRRLPHVQLGRHGARIFSSGPTSPDNEDDSEGSAALSPSDIATADELDSLQSIG